MTLREQWEENGHFTHEGLSYMQGINPLSAMEILDRLEPTEEEIEYKVVLKKYEEVGEDIPPSLYKKAEEYASKEINHAIRLEVEHAWLDGYAAAEAEYEAMILKEAKINQTLK